MEIKLYNTISENNAMSKKLSHIKDANCDIKGEISVFTPTIIIDYVEGLENVNYVYIPKYNRYYYITDSRGITGHRYELTLKCDVLMSFASDLKKLYVIIDKTEELQKANKYINDGSYVVQSNEFNTIIDFENGFNETGTYILICAGG